MSSVVFTERVPDSADASLGTGPDTACGARRPVPAACAALLERETELDGLQTLISDAAAGEARVVIIEGAGGIGKTRLLTEARREAGRQGLRVLRARGGELEHEFAFGVVRQLLEPAMTGAAQALLTGPAATARDVFHLSGPAAESGPADHSFAVLHGLYLLTAALANEQPLLLAIDDLHWADGASVRFLAYLVRRLEGSPIMVLATLRPGDRFETRALEELAADPLTAVIRPAPLSVDAASTLVAERLGTASDDAFAAACHAATAGNPLLLHELLKTLAVERVTPRRAHVAKVAELGAAASRAVLARVARLTPKEVTLARAVAVLGNDAELTTIAELAHADLEAAADGIAELARVEVLSAGPLVSFIHPLVGEAVYRDVPVPDRALWHERAARLLASRGGNPERVAAHLLHSPARGDQRVVDTLIAAARASARSGAPESTVAYLSRALCEPPPPSERAEVLLELGRAEVLVQHPCATEHLTRAYELLTDPGSRAVAAHSLSRALLLAGDVRGAAHLARMTAADLPPELADARRQLEAMELLSLLVDGGHEDELRRLVRYRRMPVGPGLGVKMLAAITAQVWTYSGGSSELCVQMAQGALAGGELITADTGLMTAIPIEILAIADREEAIYASEDALIEANRSGSAFDLRSVRLWSIFTRCWRGELADADELVRSFDDDGNGECILGNQAQLYLSAILSAVHRERGDLAEARSALERSRDRGDAGEPTRFWLYNHLELLVAEGRMEAAAAVAADFATRFAHARDAIDTPWRTPAAVALHRLGREDEALALACEDLDTARTWDAPGTLSRALRMLGTLHGEAGIDTLRDAVAVAAGTPARLQYGKALVALGAALRRARRPCDARKPLREALDLATSLGADALADEARSELYAAGARPRTTALRGVAALTPSERRVAALAATGHTNRGIAQILFVTLKTVEMHLSRAYYKLEISSRRELAAHAAELRDDE